MEGEDILEEEDEKEWPFLADRRVWMASCRLVKKDGFGKLLLYQPNLRQYCSEGVRCKKLEDEMHCAIYTHKKPVKDRSHKTLVKNRLTKSGKPWNVRIPHVSVAWEIKDKQIFPNFISNGTVIVFCHGLREGHNRVTNHINHNMSRYRQNMEFVHQFSGLEEEEEYSRLGFLAFTWPAHLGPPYTPKQRAYLASQRLQRTLEMILSHNNKIVLIGHSIGCRVCLHSLHNFDRQISSLILVAPAVPRDGLSPEGEFPANSIAAENITVCFSKNDEVLGWTFTVNEVLRRLMNMELPSGKAYAMGKYGALCTSDKVWNVDCTSEAKTHSMSYYFNSDLYAMSLLIAINDAQARLPAYSLSSKL